MSRESRLDQLVEQAREGDEEALEAVVRALQDRIYNLALRMLWHPSDAEDATQEILVKVITRLRQFRHESAFTTWVYQIAKNHLFITRRHRANGSKNVDGRAFDKPENRPTNLQIPLVRLK